MRSDERSYPGRARGGIATVTINRPKMRNAVSLAMWTAIGRGDADGSPRTTRVRAIVYRGAGTEAFASGADISEFEENRKDTETALHYNTADRSRPTARSATAPSPPWP